MNAIVAFENSGELDIRAIKSFGVSAKDSKNPIGFFGTGLKYAISILLRNGHRIRILSGERELIFDTKVDKMRGKEFEFVTMNGEELPFTTELGKTWTTVEAFRELYCNALDEGGGVRLAMREASPSPGMTRIEVIGDGIEQAYTNRDEIVLNLHDSLLLIDGDVKIYKRESKNLYYRGISVGKLRGGSQFTYNIVRKMDLTEDRSLKYDFLAEQAIARSIISLKDKPMIRRMICPEKQSFEDGLNYLHAISFTDEATPEFVEVATEEYVNSNQRLSQSARALLRAITPRDKLPREHQAVVLSEIEEKILARAKGVVRALYPDLDKYPFTVVGGLGEGCFGLADMERKEIVISKTSFALGTKFVASTILEEYTHIAYTKRDMTRELQTHLFDLVISLVEEHVLKEPI